MSFLLALLLSIPQPPASGPFANLDFSQGTFKGWENEGFYITSASNKGPSLNCAVSSSDLGKTGRTATMHRSIVIPSGAGVIRFTACSRLGKDMEDAGSLDILLLASGRQIVPKMVRSAGEWKSVGRLLPPAKGKPREYAWRVADYAGQTLRIALVDDDKRPGCHVFCAGFSIIPNDEFEGREFGSFMVKLAKDHKLAAASRFDTKHFLALSNAEDEFTELRLHNCELIYEIFLDHFRRRGFRLREPAGKMMVAIFESQAGFEAYLGRKMPVTVTGVYHPASNRLLVYDYGTNESFVAFKKNVQLEGKRIGSEMDRHRFVETENRRAREFRTGINIGTVMHEVAHQLSFNSGMLNREGDVPIWLAEGLATYCESTDNQVWQGIGEPNPERTNALAGPAQGQGRFIPLRELITSDAWLREAPNAGVILLGYAQSWALFRMLMEERPEQLQRYLTLIYPRHGPEYRVADFGQIFGADLERLELRHIEYLKDVVERYYKPRR